VALDQFTFCCFFGLPDDGLEEAKPLLAQQEPQLDRKSLEKDFAYQRSIRWQLTVPERPRTCSLQSIMAMRRAIRSGRPTG
jgi:hypothetical protein